MTALISSALQGAGIAFVPGYMCRAHLKSGKLVHVLPRWSGPPMPVSIVSTQSVGQSVRHKIVVDALVKEIEGALGV